VWTVDTYAMSGKPKERLLLRVCKRNGFEPSKDDGICSVLETFNIGERPQTVGYDNAIISLNSFVGNSFGEVNG